MGIVAEHYVASQKSRSFSSAGQGTIGKIFSPIFSSGTARLGRRSFSRPSPAKNPYSCDLHCRACFEPNCDPDGFQRSVMPIRAIK